TFVNLIVYDALGREVAYLVNDKLGVGQYSYEWDAASYPSGIYFYKLFAEDYSDTKKMVLNGFNKIN
ncbi:MAG TPA: T9SS type A sorting domain-containing protein, partial [Ignavibacteria bacterium]